MVGVANVARECRFVVSFVLPVRMVRMYGRNDGDDYFRDCDHRRNYYYNHRSGMSQSGGYTGGSANTGGQQQSYQQPPTGSPYVIGPGQYNNASGGYRQPSYHQQPQAPPRPAFLVQQQRVQQPAMQQSFIGGQGQQQQQSRMIVHPQHMIRGNVQQQQLVRLQQPQQQVQGTSPRQPGQVQIISTTAGGGMIMHNQYAGQAYPRPIIVQQSQQQPSTIIGSQQPSQPGIVQYQYKQQAQAIPQMQQSQPSLQKQPTPSPTPGPSTPGQQFTAPKQTALSASPSASMIAAGSTPVPNDGQAAFSTPQSDSSQVLTKQRLDDLVREVDPYEQLDEDVKDALLQIADEFIESVVSGACQIAKHRKAPGVDVKDVQLCLERNWSMWIPGFGTDDIRPYKKACVTEAHKQRMGLIKKTLKKI